MNEVQDATNSKNNFFPHPEEKQTRKCEFFESLEIVHIDVQSLSNKT